jgi:hypothetical protein
LVDLSSYAEQNDGFRFTFNCVDIFSRFAWIVPLKQKTALSVVTALKQIIEQSGRKPRWAWWDEGKEFLNARMTEYLESQGITGYHTYGEHGSVMVERFNRTIKTRLWKVFTEKHSYRWLDVLPVLLKQYNESKHSSIKMTPTEASDPANEQRLLALQVKNYKKHLEPPSEVSPFKIGDWVRIARKKNVFEKGYTPRWTESIYRVTSILHTNPRVYEVADMLDQKQKGALYGVQLQKTTQKPTGGRAP